MGSFRIKLAAYFVLLSLLPVGSGFLGFLVAGRARRDSPLRHTARVGAPFDARELPGRSSTPCRRRPPGLRAAATSNGSWNAAIDPDWRGFSPIARTSRWSCPAGCGSESAPPALSVRRSARVITRGDLVGTIVAYRPVDEQLARRLRTGLGLGSGEVIAVLRFSRIVASSPPIDGRIAGTPGVPGHRSRSAGLGTARFSPGPSGDFAGEQIAVLTPAVADRHGEQLHAPAVARPPARDGPRHRGRLVLRRPRNRAHASGSRDCGQRDRARQAPRASARQRTR